MHVFKATPERLRGSSRGAAMRIIGKSGTMNPVRKWFGISCFIGGFTTAVAANVFLKDAWFGKAPAEASRASITDRGSIPADGPTKMAAIDQRKSAQPQAAKPDEPAKAPPAGPSKPEAVAGLSSRIKQANVEAGRRQFKKCVACHTVAEGGKHKLGPNLWEIVGRPVASIEGYKYSSALRKTEGDWTLSRLDDFLKSPPQGDQGHPNGLCRSQEG